MTLYKIIETIKMLALKHPNINSAYEGNIYDIMNADPQHKYASVIITQQSHTQDDTYDHYNFNIFYVDRLVDDMNTNRVQVQSTGKSMLSNIIKSFCDEFDAECETINFQTFTERFADECAGVYCTITIDMIKDMTCTEKYWDESWSAPIVSIKNQDKKVVFTANGTYVIDYDPTEYTGLGMVSVEVNVPDINGSYDEGYEDGKTDGIQEGYADGKQDGIEEGYAQGKTEGFNEGKTEGYTEGKEDGIVEQKAKLEGITITENGTYTKEDGYNNIVVEVPDLNGSYDEGFDKGYAEGVEEGTSNAGQIIAQTAQVLNITKNGSYTTKYTTLEDLGFTDITGYFDDGTPFYNYAQLDGKAFMTDVIIQPDSKVEIWWRPDYNWTKKSLGDGLFSILNYGQDFCVALKDLSTGIQLEGKINDTTKTYDAGSIEDMWYHIMFSEEGLFINNYNVTGSFNGAWLSNKTLYLNICNRYGSVGSINGYFGMIKVDGNIIIPTEDGFLNQTTGNMMDVYQEGGYKFTGVPEMKGNLIRTVNVNIFPKLNMQETGLKFAYSDITDVPDWADWEGITSMCNMFTNCNHLKNIPEIDTSNVTDMSYMCQNSGGIVSVANLNTSNVTTMSHMFYNCTNLTEIPKFDTSKVTTFEYFAYSAYKLTTIPELDTSSAKTFNRMFYGATGLKYIPALYGGNLTGGTGMFSTSSMNNLTYFGGLIDVKVNWNDNYGLIRCPNLTYESCISILNNLYDFTGNGETPTSSQGNIKVHANFLTTVGDEVSIATNKGWKITA